MAKKRIILISGGGHCKACIDVIEKENRYAISGIVDVKDKVGREILGYPIIASDEKLLFLAKIYENCLISSAPIKTLGKKRSLFEKAKKAGFRFPVIISPYAHVSRYAQLGEGTIVMHNAFINAGAKIGANCVINTAAIVEHDSVIGDHCNISTGAIINGECIIGDETFIGSGSVISNGIDIAPKTIAGAGSVAIRSMKEGGVYAGHPLRRISGKKHEGDNGRS